MGSTAVASRARCSAWTTDSFEGNPLGAIVIGGIVLARAIHVYRAGWDPGGKRALRFQPARSGFYWWVTWLGGGTLGTFAIIGGTLLSSPDVRQRALLPVSAKSPIGSSYARMIGADSSSFEVEIRVVPRARRNEVGGERAGRLLVRTTAAPVDDKANAAVCKLVATFFAARERDVQIVSGHRSRDKTLRVTR